jgi:hypothetical protein
MEAFWIILVIALIAWAIFMQIAARQQLDLSVNRSERDAAAEIASYFGLLWTHVSGAGDINYRPKLRMKAPTLSISLRPVDLSRCEVSIWTSAWTVRYGLMWHAQLMWRKKRGLAARLSRTAVTATDDRRPAA